MNSDSFLIGDSPPMCAARAWCIRFGPHRITVAGIGETGSGKSVLAEELNRLSPRRKHPLVRIAAAELNPELMQGKLSGVMAGAYTSANSDRPGLLVSTVPITVFLDDIQDLPKASQPYLLDCLEDKPLRAQGGVKTFIPDVRWVIGSQEPLAALVKDKRLRRDLVARIGFVVFTLVPLRDRITDVVQLAPHLLARLAARERVELPAIGRCAMKALLEYDWPENVRQLELALHYALVMASADGAQAILREHLPDVVRGTLGNGGEPVRLDKVTLLGLLEAQSWNVTKVALMARVDRKTVQRKMREYGIRREA